VPCPSQEFDNNSGTWQFALFFRWKRKHVENKKCRTKQKRIGNEISMYGFGPTSIKIYVCLPAGKVFALGVP